MGKYLALWEIDKTKIPISQKERGEGWMALMSLVRQDLEQGIVKDWGAFVGGLKGYFVAEATEVEIGYLTQQYVPFVFFEVYPISSVSQVDDVISALSTQKA